MSDAPAHRRPRKAALIFGLLAVSLLTLAAVLALPLIKGTAQGGDEVKLRLPPARAGVDYQLGGAYPPPPGTDVLVRDRRSSPVPGYYNICYVNAFQVQPGEEELWSSDLLLQGPDGQPVTDPDWGETLINISTPDKRQRAAVKVNAWIDSCAAKGFDAVEPDNFDSYTRSNYLLTAEHAMEYLALLSAHAHSRQLAIAQKNAAELAEERQRTGVDFAIVEECAAYDECETYRAAFGDRVIIIEYTDPALATACARWGDNLSIVRRDRPLEASGHPGHIRKTCMDV